MRLTREDLVIDGGRKLYLYSFDQSEELEQKQAKLWSSVSDAWRKEGVVEEWFSPVTREMVRMLGAEGGRLLDVGCGAQTIPIPQSWNVVGLDIARPMLQKKFTNVVASCAALPFRSESFDAAISRFGIIFAPQPAIAFSEASRVLKCGGILVLAVWASEFENQWTSAVMNLLTERTGLSRPAKDEPSAFRLCDDAEVRKYLQDSNLIEVEKTDLEVRFLALMEPEDAVRHTLTFAGPQRGLFGRLPAAEREAVFGELLGLAETVDRRSHAKVWAAKKTC